MSLYSSHGTLLKLGECLHPMTSKLVPVTLIGGYLGSGKTTLINHVLAENQNQRIAILVNDFGDLAIDATLIESEKDNIISLNGGCVYCSYGNDLSNAVMDVMALQATPDQIIIEASGVALPGAIASSLSLIQGIVMHSVIVMANAETVRRQFNDRYVGDTIQRQLDAADLLVINKVDLISQDQLQALQAWISQQIPTAKQVCTERSQLPVSVLLDGEIAHSLNDKDTASTMSHASLFSTFKIDLPSTIDAAALAQYLASEQANLVRAKGFVKDPTGHWMLIQIVGQRFQVARAPEHTQNSLTGGVVCIALADTLNASAINARVDRLSTSRKSAPTN